MTMLRDYSQLCIQELFLSDLGKPHGMARVEPVSAVCKVSALPAILSSSPSIVYFEVSMVIKLRALYSSIQSQLFHLWDSLIMFHFVFGAHPGDVLCTNQQCDARFSASKTYSSSLRYPFEFCCSCPMDLIFFKFK